MITEKDKQEYLKVIIETLIEKYEMPYEDAKAAVDMSLAKKLLYENEGQLAAVQMHDPLDYTVQYTYCEYKGMPIEYLRTL